MRIVNDNVPMKKLIFKLSWPVIAEQSLATITQVVDMMMVGRLGAAAVTAIGLTFQPLLLAQSIGAALSIGTTALVSRFVGAEKPGDASRVLKQSLLMSIVLSLLGGAIFFFMAEGLIKIMGAEKEVIAPGASYLRYIVPGFLFMFFTFIISAALRGAGDTKTPMKVNIFINIINVILNYILIFGHFGLPAMGLDGAGLATSIARSIGGIILIIYIFRENSVLRVFKTNFFHLDLALIKRLINIGFPTAMEQVVMRVAQILFVRIVASLGTLSFAAHQISINVESISYMPGFGIAVAATTLVGQNLGANQPEKAEESTYESWKIGLIIMGLMSLIFLFLPEFIVSLYTDNREIIRLASRNLRIVALAQLPMGTQFIFAGALRGAGDTRSVFYSTAISTWISRFFLSYLFIKILNWGLIAAWIVMVIDWFLRGTYVYFKFRQGKWKNIKV